jgi:hypothetical protein
MPPVHIRRNNPSLTLCGRESKDHGTVSQFHVAAQPEHIKLLVMCRECLGVMNLKKS